MKFGIAVLAFDNPSTDLELEDLVDEISEDLGMSPPVGAVLFFWCILGVFSVGTMPLGEDGR